MADFDRAIELDPESGAAYYSRAVLHTKPADPDKAQEDIPVRFADDFELVVRPMCLYGRGTFGSIC